MVDRHPLRGRVRGPPPRRHVTQVSGPALSHATRLDLTPLSGALRRVVDDDAAGAPRSPPDWTSGACAALAASSPSGWPASRDRDIHRSCWKTACRARTGAAILISGAVARTSVEPLRRTGACAGGWLVGDPCRPPDLHRYVRAVALGMCGGLLDACAYEGIGDLGPRRAHAQGGGRDRLVWSEARDQRGEHPLAARAVPCHRPGGVEARRHRLASLQGHEAMAPLEVRRAAARRGDVGSSRPSRCPAPRQRVLPRAPLRIPRSNRRRTDPRPAGSGRGRRTGCPT